MARYDREGTDTLEHEAPLPDSVALNFWSQKTRLQSTGEILDEFCLHKFTYVYTRIIIYFK